MIKRINCFSLYKKYQLPSSNDNIRVEVDYGLVNDLVVRDMR